MNIGVTEAVLILLVVLVLFGAGKLPNVMGDMAKGIKAFRRGLKEPDGETAPATAPPADLAKADPQA